MHKVIRTFTTGRGRVRVNDVVDGTRYRNLGFLIRRGYLIDVGDVEVTYKEEDIPEPVAEITEATAVPETPASSGDILDQIASEPVSEPALSRSTLQRMSKAKLVTIAELGGKKVTPDSMTNKEIIDVILGENEL